MKTGQKPAIVGQERETRLAVAKQFIEDVIFGQYWQLVAWETVTGQSSQIDSGYLAQQLVSLLTGIPGTATRGKGLDMQDGSEVKAASSLSGVDIPRWNNQVGTRVRQYLELPAIYFVLFDTKVRGEAFPLRVRVWKVRPTVDFEFKEVVNRWAKGKSSGNRAEQLSLAAIDHMVIHEFVEDPGTCKKAQR